MTGTPRLAGGRRIGGAIALVAVLGTLLGSLPARALTSAGAQTDSPRGTEARVAERLRVGEDAWQLLKLTNAARERRGLPKMLLDRERSGLAKRHSRDMAVAGELYHTDDVNPYLAGIDWRRWGENVGYTPGSIASLHDAFMASEPHRHNVLEPDFRRVAIGTYRADGVLWVTLFFYG